MDRECNIRTKPPTRSIRPCIAQLPRGAKMYDGSTKPEDWLTDYVTAVHIADGSRRWAVRYVPQMLEGPARIWLDRKSVV